MPIPLPYKSKVPVLDDWTNLRVTANNVAQFFNGERQNIGVLLGEPSKNLIDIDLDCPEAVELAPIILPPTNAIFGRAGKQRSHFLYTVHNLICSKRFKNPANTNETLVEQRSTGGQTVFPGSVHPSGEPVEWASDGKPAEVPADELEAAVRHLAVACLVRRYGQANINFADVEALLLALASAPEKAQEAARVWLRSEPQNQVARDFQNSKRSARGSDNFWRALNTAGLKNLDKWVRVLFPGAVYQTGTGAWRVSSRHLGRSLQEDLSLHPDGIQDFGEETALTAIDTVLKFGGAADAQQAALWLCEQIGVAAESLGFKNAKPQSKSQTTVDDDKTGNQTGAEGVSLDDFHAYMPQHSYIYSPTRELWPASSVNSRIPPIPLFDAEGLPVLNKKDEQVELQANAWLDRNQPVEQMTWCPGLPMLIRNRLVTAGGWVTRNQVTVFNLYRPPMIESGDAAQVEPWLAHVRRVFPDDANHIIKWLAHRVQRPQEKINHALVLGSGDQGIGKDTLLEPAKRAVGPWNFDEVSPQQIMGRFNGFLKNIILRVNEARDLGDVNRFQFYDHMKAYLASPPDVLRVDEKNLREYSIFNCVGVIITTNHKSDGIFLPQDDRRHYVAWSNLRREDFADGYWKTLWHWYDTGGDCNVAAYLAELDISGFDPKAPPPKTPAFWDIVDANRAPEDAELADALDQLKNPDATTIQNVINATTREDFQEWLQDRRNRRAIPYRMEKCGYVPVRNEADKSDGHWKLHGRRQVIYAKLSLSLRDRISAAQKLVQDINPTSDQNEGW